MKTQPYLESKKYSRLVFAACFAAYTASYVGRINYSAALSAIVSSGLFTKPQAGMIGSAFFFVYGAFQIINGFLGDRISPFKMIMTGTSLAAVLNVVMAFCKTNVQMAVVWGFNGFAMSLLWAAILKILANIINDGMRERACLNICATLPVGTVTAYLLASLSIKFFDWRYVFISAAIILAGASVFFTGVYLSAKKHIIQRTVEAEPVNENKAASTAKTLKLLPIMAAAGLLLVLPADAIHGAIKEGITTWVPTMLTEVYDTSASFSVFISILLPICNLSGSYIITPIYNKVFKQNEIKTGSAILVFALIPLSMLIFMRNLPIIVSVVLLAVSTTAMHTYNYMIITLVPMRFAYAGRTASVTGVMNAVAYVGCAASSYGFGLVSELIGWNGTVLVWIGLNALALIVNSFAIRPWTKFKQKNIPSQVAVG